MVIQIKFNKYTSFECKKKIEIKKFTPAVAEQSFTRVRPDYELVLGISNEEDYRNAEQLPPDNCI